MRFLLLSVLVVFLVGIMVQNAFAEITITDDATGGGCATIGTWDSASKTCTLTSDVSEQITIDSDGITLDGNSHTITLTQHDGTGITNSAYHNNITVKNFKIISPTNIAASGIHLVGTNIIVSNNEFTDILGNAIAIDQGSAENSYCGYGGSACDESGIEIFGNIITKPSYEPNSTWAPGIYVWAVGAKVYENTVDHHGMGIHVCWGTEVFRNTFSNNQNAIDKRQGGDNCTGPAGNAVFYNNNFINNNSVSDNDTQQISYQTESPLSPNYFDNDWIECQDSNYDNLCENTAGMSLGDGNYVGADGVWNIPDGWLTTISTDGDIASEATLASGGTVSYSVTAEKSGQSVSVSCDHTSGSTFPFGSTQVICSTDEGRVSAFTVTVSDTVSPTIAVPNDLESHTSVPQGIIVDYSSVTASDAVGLSGSASCDMESGALFPIGETTVTCTATDTSGNSSSETFKVTVISDVPLPVINVPNDIVVEATTEDGSYVDYPAVTATDSSGIAEGPTCYMSSGNFFDVGSTTVTCTATNPAGFLGTGTFTITVNPFIPPPMIVDVLLPTNGELERGWNISNVRGDQTYSSSGAYIQGYEKKYVRTSGYYESVVLSAAVFQVTESGSFSTNQEIAEEERDRNFTNARDYNTPAGYSNFSPWGFPSECEGIEEDFGLNVRIKAYCLTGDYYYSVVALASAWDVDDDVVDFTKVILNKIGVAPEPEAEPEPEVEPEAEPEPEPEAEPEPEVEPELEVEQEPEVEPEPEAEPEAEVEEVTEPEPQYEVDIFYDGSICDSGIFIDGICQIEVCDSGIIIDGICQIEVPQPEVEVTGSEPELAQQSSVGCGEGTILVNGVCQLAPTQSSAGCGEGTVMVNGVCQLAPTQSKSTFMSIEPLYLIIGAAAIGAAIIGIVFAVKRGSGTPKPAREELEEYESRYVARKPAEKKETSSSCSNCGNTLNPKAKFCGSCGNQV